MKPNRYTLKKIESLLEELDYEVIYDRGHFHSGYCIVEQQKKIVINKYYDIEGRVNNLMEIVDSLEIYPHLLTNKSRSIYLEIKKMQSQ